MNKRVLALIGLVLVCACSASKKEANVNLAGYPPSFRAGYLDGCESGNRTTGPKKDEHRFTHDPQYASGWRDGYDICSKRKK